jgi:hypothetical protein
MEVHHHPDLHHKPKPWKEYLLEYLMIFLAVMTGFFAESFREHLGDKNKEREYLISLVAELKADTTQYNKCLVDIAKMRPNLDSLFVNASHPERYNYIIKGKWNTPVNENGVSYMPTLSSIQQLKSSGNLRLIGDKEIALQMITYETFIEGDYRHHFNAIDAASERLYGLEDVICDETEFNTKVNNNIISNTDNDDQGHTGIFDMPIKVKDNVQLNQLANSVVNFNSRCWGYMTAVKRAKGMARTLINNIQREYKLNDE